MTRVILLGLAIGLIAPYACAEQFTDSLEGEAAAGINNQLQDIESKKDELLGLLAQVDERYGDVAASLKAIEVQIAKTNESLAKLRKEAGKYQAEINRLSTELSGQIKAAYAMGQQDRLKLMLNQRDPALSSRMMIYYEYVNKSRLEKLDNLKRTVKYLDGLDKDKQAKTDELGQNLEQKKAQQAALDEVRKQRDALVGKLNTNESSEEIQLNFLKQNEIKLINLIKTLENDHSPAIESTDTQDSEETESFETATNQDEGSFPKVTGDFFSLKGKLPFPVRGKLSSMLDKSSETDASLKGVLINAKEGDEVRAVTDGQIAYAGILKGYGLLLIVEHSKNFMSLYAFNQNLLKHKGDKVEAGDVIATVGQSGGRDKPGLYFEIRQDGKPVDPLLWCRN